MTNAAAETEPDDVGCLLPQDEQDSQLAGLEETVLPRVNEARELDDGYLFAFDFDKEFARELLELVFRERACCPFQDMELGFERNHGALTLAFRGPEGTKTMIQETLQDADIDFDLPGVEEEASGEASQDEGSSGCGCGKCG